MFKDLARRSTDDLVRGYWLSIVKCGPEYESNQLGVGKEILMKSVARACGSSTTMIRDLVKQTGDLGLAAQRCKKGQKTMSHFFKSFKQPVPLTIQKVFNSFVTITKTKGNSSIEEKQNILQNLLLESKEEETKFLIRWVEGNLNISAGQKTMQKALIIALFQQLFPR